MIGRPDNHKESGQAVSFSPFVEVETLPMEKAVSLVVVFVLSTLICNLSRINNERKFGNAISLPLVSFPGVGPT